jgi:prefoldin subunit 5
MAKDQLISDLKQSVAQLDSNLDDMQNELDNKTEEVVQAR